MDSIRPVQFVGGVDLRLEKMDTGVERRAGKVIVGGPSVRHLYEMDEAGVGCFVTGFDTVAVRLYIFVFAAGGGGVLRVFMEKFG